MTVKVSAKKIKGAAHKNDDVDSTCKEGLKFIFYEIQTLLLF